ncbi:MAG: hypothetical protein Q4G03_03100 [Planctomycetia bacterium]|nr:hypothetical protein [Planctomycetia bacterium]
MPLFDDAMTQGLSAPYLFVLFFKTLGFALHLIPMGIWLVGTPCSILLWLFGGMNAKRMAQRFFQQTPILIALGINLGIVPLLFVQLAYPKLFYTSTILVAAHWLGILPVALFAYYACYLSSHFAKKEKLLYTAFFSAVATLCFCAIGLVFSSVWTLFERPYEWEELWRSSAYSFSILGHEITLGGFGSASGLGIYWREMSIFLRFGAVAGVSFLTLATWQVFDAFYLYRGPRVLTDEEELRLLEMEEQGGKKVRGPIQENPEVYPRSVTSIACAFIFLGLFIAIPTLGQYLLRTAQELSSMQGWNQVLWYALIGTMAFSVFLALLFLLLFKIKKVSGRTLAIWMTISDLLMVGAFASLRQWLQNLRLAPYYSPKALEDAAAVDWSAIFLFLGVFLVTLTLIIVFLRLMATATPKSGSAKRRRVKTKKEPKEKKSSTKKNKGEEEFTDAHLHAEQLTLGQSKRPNGGGLGSSTGGKNGIRRI